jgi:hypothetical protein
VTHLKSQRLHGEAALKGRDREIEKLGKMIDQLKSEVHDVNFK